jgi:hypothetical protein
MTRILWMTVCAFHLCGQHAELRIYSEFDRLNAAGELIENVPGRTPQEIISPGVIRNGFTSFHIAVTARPGILYWLAIQSNPPNVFGIRVYKESAPASSLVMDELREEAKPTYFLGVMSATGKDVFLLDLWTPVDAPVRTVRLEVLVKEAYWVVAPMEVRVLPARAPNLDTRVCCAAGSSAEQTADSFAWEALLSAFTDVPLRSIPSPVTVRSVIRRNAIQDAAVIRTLPLSERRTLLNRVVPDLMLRYASGLLSFDTSADVYLPVRRLVFRLASGTGPP